MAGSFRWGARMGCAVAVLAGLLASAAQGVILAASDDAPNLIAPGNDPGWLNVGRVAGASGVYLGNRWVITADHVDSGNFRLSDGRVIAATVGSNIQLNNQGISPFGSPDLRMFRLAEDPGLPALSIASNSPAMATQVMMIGAGVSRNTTPLGWQLTPTALGYDWHTTPLPHAHFIGYNLGGASKMRWGMNMVAEPSAYRGVDGTWVYSTTFDQTGMPFEAQATPGDSGGGVFFETPTGWVLSGIMISSLPMINQPGNTVVFGQGTSIADLSVYRNQILQILERPTSLWQNPANYYDVNGSGDVSTRDVMLLVNALLRDDSRDLSGPRGDSNYWLDVNGDLELTRADLMAVVNQILRQRGPQMAAMPMARPYAIPEPSSVALGFIGAATLVLARAASRARHK